MPYRTASSRTVKRLPLAALSLALLAGCGTASVAPLPPPPPVSEVPTSTTLADFSNVALPRVNGTTTTLPAMFRGGAAQIQGRVTLGGAPVGGATVRIERYDADSVSGTLDATTDAEGRYLANSLHGGRYRVRAFRAPDAGMGAAQVFFLGATENRGLDLSMTTYTGGLTVSASVTPDPPILGLQATVTVSVSTRGVDASGVARSVPSPGVPVSLVSSGGRAIVSANPTTTGANGRASFTIQCNALDRQGLSVVVAGAAPTSVNVAACQLPTTTTAPPVPEDTTVTIGGVTTTTARR
jgi:hypothetical protein